MNTKVDRAQLCAMITSALNYEQDVDFTDILIKLSNDKKLENMTDYDWYMAFKRMSDYYQDDYQSNLKVGRIRQSMDANQNKQEE